MNALSQANCHLGKAVFILAVLLLFAGGAWAQATISVNSTAQEVTLANPNGIVNSNCTLGEAILAANTNAAVDGCAAGQTGGTDIIMIPAGTYTLTDIAKNPAPFNTPVGLPDITEAVILQGAGATTTILERSTAAITPAFAMTAAFGGSVVFANLTIRNFFTTCGQGGAAIMRFTVPVTLNDSIVEDNFSDANCGGGAGAFAEMFNSNAAFTATNTLFRNNTAQFTTGVVLEGSGPVTLTNCTFLDNPEQNAAVLVIGGNGPHNISDSVFSGNTTIPTHALRFVGLGNCGPGCGSFPVIKIMRSYFVNNRNGYEGGAIHANTVNPTLTIVDSMFADNHANHGGAMLVGGASGSVVITNSTFSGNTAGGFGAAIYASASSGDPNNFPITLNNVTITDNLNTFFLDGGALMAEGDVNFRLRNSIVANNGPQCEMRSNGPGVFASQGHNVFGHTACANFTVTDPSDQTGTQANPLNPLVGGLADNGSTVMAGANISGVISPQVIQTLPLLTGSPALESGDPGTPPDGTGTRCEAADQRGVTRPQPNGGTCDSGALEDLTGLGVTAQADFSITKSGAPASVSVGQNITFTITVTNNGPDPAAGSFSDVLPASFHFVSLTSPAGWTCTAPAVGASGTVSCSHPGLSATLTGSFTLVVTATGAGAAIANTATASVTGIDANSSNDSATANTTVTASNADLGVTKSGPASITLGGGNITYTVVVTNNGPGDATNVGMTDTLPAGVTFVSVTPTGPVCTQAASTVTCNLGGIVNGGSATVTIVVTPTAAATLSNTATVTATEPDPTPGNNTATAVTTVNPSADLAVTKTGAPNPVNVGANLTYTITLTNNGPSAAASVSLSDALPAGVNFVSLASPASWTCTTPAVGANGTASCTNPSVVSGVSAVFTLVVTPSAAAAASISNTVTVSSATSDANAANNSQTATTTVNPVADLAITKTDTPDPVSVNSDITYTITLRNNGPSSATGVSVTDAVPANVNFVSATGSGTVTCALAAGVITCNVGTLANGATATATVVVLTTALGTVTNTVNVTSTSTDPTPANNSDTATTTVSVPPSTDFQLTLVPLLRDIHVGGTATYTATLTPLPANSAFITAIAVTCFTNLPGAICNASPNSATPGTSPASSNITVTLPQPSMVPGAPGRWQPPVIQPWVLWTFWAMLLAGILMVLRSKKRRMQRGVSLAMLLIALALMGGMSACSSALNPPVGPYVLTVTATSGSLSHSATSTVNVVP